MLKTIQAQELILSIISSPLVSWYNIGITCNTDARRKSYRGIGFDHFAIIEFGLSAQKALGFEKNLHEILLLDKRMASYKKYRNNANGSHKPSLGGKPINNDKNMKCTSLGVTKDHLEMSIGKENPNPAIKRNHLLKSTFFVF